MLQFEKTFLIKLSFVLIQALQKDFCLPRRSNGLQAAKNKTNGSSDDGLQDSAVAGGSRGDGREDTCFHSRRFFKATQRALRSAFATLDCSGMSENN